MKKNLWILTITIICIGILSLSAAALDDGISFSGFSVETGDCVVNQATATAIMGITYSTPNIESSDNYWVGIEVSRDPSMSELACGMSERISNSAIDAKTEFTMYPDAYIVPGQTYYYQGYICERRCAIDKDYKTICAGEIKPFTVPGIVKTMSLDTVEVLEYQQGKDFWYTFIADESGTYALDLFGDKSFSAVCNKIETSGIAKYEKLYIFSEDETLRTVNLEKGEAIIFSVGGPKSGKVEFSVYKADIDVALDPNGGTWDDETSEIRHCTLHWKKPYDDCPLSLYSNLKKGNEAFIGWNTKANGSGTFFNTNDTIHPTDTNIKRGKITLYAQWQKRNSEQSILFVPCGGTFEDGTESTKDTDNRIAPLITRDGYTFAGWLDNDSINSNSSITIPGNLYLPGEYIPESNETSVYKGYKQDKIEMRGDRAEMSDFPLYLNTVAGGLDRRDQTIGGFSFVVKIYTVPVVEIIG